MTEKTRVAGNTTIASEVIETIIKMTTSEMEGVKRIYTTSSNTGVKMKLENGSVSADVYVVLDQRKNAIETGKELRNNISRAISEMVGLEPGRINIHVEDYDFGGQEKLEKSTK